MSVGQHLVIKGGVRVNGRRKNDVEHNASTKKSETKNQKGNPAEFNEMFTQDENEKS